MRSKPSFLLVIFTAVLFVMQLSADDRREYSFMVGSGTAVSCFKGMFLDIGAEIPFARYFYVQGMFDYYFRPGGGQKPDDTALSFSLYGVFKIRLAERWGLFLKAGPNYTIHNTTERVYGVYYPVRNTNYGIGGGLGFHYLFAHRLYFQLGGTVKVRFTEDNTVENYWVKIYGGFRYLIGVKKNQ